MAMMHCRRVSLGAMRIQVTRLPLYRLLQSSKMDSRWHWWSDRSGEGLGSEQISPGGHQGPCMMLRGRQFPRGSLSRPAPARRNPTPGLSGRLLPVQPMTAALAAAAVPEMTTPISTTALVTGLVSDSSRS